MSCFYFRYVFLGVEIPFFMLALPNHLNSQCLCHGFIPSCSCPLCLSSSIANPIRKRLLDCQIGSMIYHKKSIFQYNNISIPEEFLEEILSRLPVKSLTRFTSVQKPWSNTLLQNPTFIANHLLLQQTNSNPTLFFKSYD